MTVTRESRCMSRVTPRQEWRDIRSESQHPSPTHPNPALPMSLGCAGLCPTQAPSPSYVTKGSRIGLGR